MEDILILYESIDFHVLVKTFNDLLRTTHGPIARKAFDNDF